MQAEPGEVLQRELAYYENLYSTYGPRMFAQPGVVLFRRYLVRRLLRATGIGAASRVLSIGCGIGDTELLLAPHVAHITGVDLSPAAIAEARQTASARTISNVEFIAGAWQTADLGGRPFDAVIAIFFLHHLPDPDLAAFANQLARLLRSGGVFYALDPSARRLSGFLGQILVPKLMAKYQTEDERQLLPRSATEPFRRAGFAVTTRWFDFASTPLAGLFPSWGAGYRASRVLDEALTRTPLLCELSSNFELIARKP
ncbi:MAG TPA: class I SAM-dependent methyltransferase [Bryobacteraceae bacterium]|nr:class I SAM-dependent methyltransferase [Bryobacteraceae bacterium]